MNRNANDRKPNRKTLMFLMIDHELSNKDVAGHLNVGVVTVSRWRSSAEGTPDISDNNLELLKIKLKERESVSPQ